MISIINDKTSRHFEYTFPNQLHLHLTNRTLLLLLAWISAVSLKGIYPYCIFPVLRFGMSILMSKYYWATFQNHITHIAMNSTTIFTRLNRSKGWEIYKSIVEIALYNDYHLTSHYQCIIPTIVIINDGMSRWSLITT